MAIVGFAVVVDDHRQDRGFSVNGVRARAQGRGVSADLFVAVVAVVAGDHTQARAARYRACVERGPSNAVQTDGAAARERDVAAAGRARRSGCTRIEHQGGSAGVVGSDDLRHRQVAIGGQVDGAAGDRDAAVHRQVAARARDDGRDTACARDGVADHRVGRAPQAQAGVVAQRDIADAQGASAAAVAHLQGARTDGRGAGVGIRPCDGDGTTRAGVEFDVLCPTDCARHNTG